MPAAPQTGAVFMVATPIGNLGDMGARAREVLAAADWIACEDTRRTGQLLEALGLGGVALRRFDRHTEAGRVRAWVEEIREKGQSVAVVTDAGTPGVSDPGALLVREAVAGGVPVIPVPGPASWTALVSISGWPEVSQWVCSGFFPRKTAEKQAQIRDSLAAAGQHPGEVTAQLWLESPERILETIEAFEALSRNFPECEFLLAKELTKVHETVFRGSWEQVAEALRRHEASEGRLGEWCFAVKFPRFDAATATASASGLELGEVIELLLDAGIKVTEIARLVSHRFGVSRDEAYLQAGLRKKNRLGG